MYYKIKSNVIFRNYESFGYLTDNRNFRYKQANGNAIVIGDKIVSESGAVFISFLDREPQTIDELAKRINSQYTNVEIEEIKNDALDFYSTLENEGFIVSGKTIQECNKRDTKFSYKTFDLDKKKDLSSSLHLEKTSQDFLEEHFNGKPQLTNLHLEIVSECNERCIHCYIPHAYKVSCIGSDMFYNILEQCKNMRLLHITLSGGEPMLHKNFCDFLKRCREYNFSINVLSNLTLLNEEIVNEMKMNPLLSVQASLYSMDSNIHDGITQMKGSFKKTYNAILKLIENDIPLQISCPIMKQNKTCYNDVLKWAKRLRIHAGDDYGLIARYDHTTQNLSCRLSIDEIKEVIKDKAKNDSEFLEQIKMEAEKKQTKTINDVVCSVCHSSICITDNGNVYPCAGWQNYVVGSIKENSLNEIWNNSEKINYLRTIRNQDFPRCIQCQDKNFCTMCMVKNANENSDGDPLVLNEFFCNIANLNRQIYFESKGKVKTRQFD